MAAHVFVPGLVDANQKRLRGLLMLLGSRHEEPLCEVFFRIRGVLVRLGHVKKRKALDGFYVR